MLVLIPKILLLVKQIRPRTTQIDNLGTTIAILLQTRTLKAIEGVTDPLTTADNTFVLIVAKGAFVADAHECSWADVRVAHGAFAIAFVAETADRDAGLFAAHDEIGVMARHDSCW
jgi:hypothetical protein